MIEDSKTSNKNTLRPTRLTLEELQAVQREWVEHNFPNRTNYHPLLGAVEEIGELCHAHLKYEQGIRSMSQAKVHGVSRGCHWRHYNLSCRLLQREWHQPSRMPRGYVETR